MANLLFDMLGKLRSAAPAGTVRFSDCLQQRREHWRAHGTPKIVRTLFNKRLSLDLARQLGVATPDTLRELPNIDALPALDTLPNRFVLKPVQGSNNRGVFLFEGGKNWLDGKRYNRQDLIDAVTADTALKPGGPFLIEEFLQNWNLKPGAPNDFKFYNFGSRTAFVHLIERNDGRNAKLNRHWFLRDDWTPLGRTIQPTQIHASEPLTLPPFAAGMLALSQRLSAHIGMFVRIDLYATTRGPVFGEFTLNPHGGKGYAPDGDRWLGAMWRGATGVEPTMDRLVRT
jgi:TupA-like ATPgrasp